jgi:hypothetical protein
MLHYKRIKLQTRQKSFLTCFVFLCSYCFAQQPYFQQEVNYTINVKLDDVNHFLRGHETIQYINNDNKAISYIYFHLWPNAYKNKETALARQLVENGDTKLFYAEPKELGYIDSLNFTGNGKALKIEATEHIDVIKLILNEPLKSLDTLKIETPFLVKIPSAKFSRLGHTKQAYFITQWYPKPAVYDRQGWHPMPYLDQGEFFSEFGSFDVSITLPKNYLLSATGDRINAEEEEDWLNNKVAATIKKLERNEFNSSVTPASDTELKTVRFQQFKVHDFAWFADKNFNVLHDQIELPNTKRTVDTWIFFTDKNAKYWKEAIGYINESTLFYSYLNGDYPYNHVTAVDGTIMAGGGMEYPNITVIGDVNSDIELDITITHEVGHNWFYGILGSNERDYPAMDEGLNSFYEMRYMQAKYPNKKIAEYLGLPFKDTVRDRFGIARIPFWKEKEITYLLSALANTDQPIQTKAQDFTEFNYGSIVYSKSAVAFQYLMYYMGTEKFDKAMQFYFDNYKFTHPEPADLFKTFQYFSDVDISWFRDYFILENAKIDYKLKSHKQHTDGSHTITIKNKTNAIVPFAVHAYRNDNLVGTVWSDGFSGKKELQLPPNQVDYFVIDGERILPETYRHNNTIYTKRLFKKLEPFKFNLFGAVENPKYSYINYIPLIGNNFYNQWMLGMAFHNFGLYSKKFDYLIAPMYAFKTKTITGSASIAVNRYPKRYFEKISLGSDFKTYAYDRFETKFLNELNNTHFESPIFNYHRISPFIQFTIKPLYARSPFKQILRYTNHNVWRGEADLQQLPDFSTKGIVSKTTFRFVNELQYVLTNKRVIDPYSFTASLQHTDKMAKLGLNLDYNIHVNQNNAFKFSAFVGTFIAGSAADRAPYLFRMSGFNGYHDYLYENVFVARKETQGFGFAQFAERDGSFKVWTPLGQTSEWLAAVHVVTPRIFILPFKLFADVGTADGRSLNTEKVLYCAGFNITIIKNVIDIYIPAIYSSDIKKTLDLNNKKFWDTIRFTLNIHNLDFKNFSRNNLF